MREELNCFTCGSHIGYAYSSCPIHPINCVQCGQKEREDEEEDE